MHKHITGSVLFLDKTIALLAIEPLHLTVDIQMSSFPAKTPLSNSLFNKGKPLRLQPEGIICIILRLSRRNAHALQNAEGNKCNPFICLAFRPKVQVNPASWC
jgi:hypothetical protein